MVKIRRNGQIVRKLISLLLALTVASSASADGICAMLCRLGVCCSSQNVASAPVAKEPAHSCCKDAKKAEAPKESEPQEKDCCKLMGSDIKGPDATLAKIFAPQIDFPILHHEPAITAEPKSTLEKAPKFDTNEGRAPPGPEHRSDSPRAPPVARV